MEQTDFQMLRTLEKDFVTKTRGILDADEVEKIEKVLQINERKDIINLRNLRNFVVLFYDNKEHAAQPQDVMLLADKCSGITAVIDRRIFELGGEV